MQSHRITFHHFSCSGNYFSCFYASWISTRHSSPPPPLALLQKLVGEYFWFFAAKFGKFSGKFGGNFPGFFLTHRTKALKIPPAILGRKWHKNSSGAWRGAPDGVATLKVRKGAFDALNKKGLEHLESEVKLSPPRGSGAPPEELYERTFLPNYFAQFWGIFDHSFWPTQEPPPSPFSQLTRTMVWVLPGRKLGPWSELPFLYRFTVLLNSGGSNSPWSEFWSEFPRFMGMGVVPAPSTFGPNNKINFVIITSNTRPTLLGPGPESAPRSAFWAILGTCLGVPQRVLFECFLAFFGPKNAKKHSKGTLWGTPRQVPKIAQKALRGALSGPGPKGTPVNGGRDRKT